MFGFANEKIFVCVNKNIIQSYKLYDEKEFEEEFKNYNRVETILYCRNIETKTEIVNQ